MQCFLIKAKAFLQLLETKKTMDVHQFVSKETELSRVSSDFIRSPQKSKLLCANVF